MQKTKLKICGMREELNIKEVLRLHPDYMGFIFYKDSPRYAGESLSEELLLNFPESIAKVAVFVNASEKEVKQTVKKYAMDYIQLHGDESPEFCKAVAGTGAKVIKVFRVDESFDFKETEPYLEVADLFLFDTKAEAYGGTGFTFNWDLLKGYKYDKPFLLSGGISSENLKYLTSDILEHIHGIDVNSGFEAEPGIKDMLKLKTLHDWLVSSR